MIAIGQLVVLPGFYLATVFANYEEYVGVEMWTKGELVWIEEKTLVPPEEPTEEEVAYG